MVSRKGIILLHKVCLKSYLHTGIKLFSIFLTYLMLSHNYHSPALTTSFPWSIPKWQKEVSQLWYTFTKVNKMGRGEKAQFRMQGYQFRLQYSALQLKCLLDVTRVCEWMRTIATSALNMARPWIMANQNSSDHCTACHHAKWSEWRVMWCQTNTILVVPTWSTNFRIWYRCNTTCHWNNFTWQNMACLKNLKT
jgi:hypothetical protein